MRLIPSLLIGLSLTHCGVEAGNAGKGRTGQVKVLFTQESSSGSESLNVSVGSLGLLSSDDTELATISPSVSSVDLYNSGNATGENVLVAESMLIPAGRYAKIAIRLQGDKPVRYRDESGQEIEVGIDDDIKESFYITQEIEVANGETTTILINLDPHNSLARPDSAGPFRFSPRGQVAKTSSTLRYEGTTNRVSAKWACLYAFGPDIEQGPLGPVRGGSQSKGNSDKNSDLKPKKGFLKDPRGPGREVEGRPKAGSKADLVKDESSTCSRAFAKTLVKDGKFEFRHLSEGSYSLRIFSSDGSYGDEGEDIIVKGED